MSEIRQRSRRATAVRWIHRNLFSSVFNTILTVVAVPLLGWVLYGAIRFVFVEGRWEIIERNLRLLMVFRFPPDQTWRIWLAIFVVSLCCGLAAGTFSKVRAQQVLEGRAKPLGKYVTLRRIGPAALAVALLLILARSVESLVFVLVGVALFIGARWLGRRLIPRRYATVTVCVAFVSPFIGMACIAAFGGVPWGKWGGLLLTLTLTTVGIAVAFPLGALLAFGRRSRMPVFKAVSIIYIELVRGVPLVTLLFLGSFVIGLMFPPGGGEPTLMVRILTAIVIFTSAYIAEIIRGGIQAVPPGQVEAAEALGLSTVATIRLIVLPQALRAVIPGLVSQFISLFKDTSLVYVIGMTELLQVSKAITQQPDYAFQGYIVETLAFAALLYWVGSYTMSRESQRLERRLGVGER